MTSSGNRNQQKEGSREPQRGRHDIQSKATLIVWGYDLKDPLCNEQLQVFAASGCNAPAGRASNRDFRLEELGRASWTAVEFPDLATAEACVATLRGFYGHLGVCVEPDWRALGSDEATAAAGLLRLAEWLGCRGKPRALPQHEAACLTRGMNAMLAAVEKVGGGYALAVRDRAAAFCLAHCLTEVAYGMCYKSATQEHRQRIASAFQQLGPRMLRGAAADTCSGVPGSAQRAAAAARLTESLVMTHVAYSDTSSRLYLPFSQEQQEEIAALCVALLQAVTDALPACSRAVARGAQAAAARQAAFRNTMVSMGEHSRDLQMAVQSLLLTLRQNILRSGLSKRQLLETLGQLVQQLVCCAEAEKFSAAAGLLPQFAGWLVVGCLHQLQLLLKGVLPTMDRAGCTAAGLPALHSAVVEALRTALDRLATPQYIGLLLGLSFIAQDTLPEHAETQTICGLVAQLCRVRQLVSAWLDRRLQELLQEACVLCEDQQPYGTQGLELVIDQLALLADINSGFLSELVMVLVDRCLAPGTLDIDNVVALEAIEALACFQLGSMPNCGNVRAQCPEMGLAQEDSYSFAPGLSCAGMALLKVAMAPCSDLDTAFKDARRRPWATGLVIALVNAGTNTLWLARVEAAVAGHPDRTPDTRREGVRLVGRLKCAGAALLQLATLHMTAGVAYALAPTMAVTELLRVLTSTLGQSEEAADTTSWEADVQAIGAVSGVLAAILAGDETANEIVRRRGHWDKATQALRKLQPPVQLAAGWPEQREAMLHKVSAVLGSSAGGGTEADGGAAAADAEAVAAADRAMQELLAEEQAAEAPSQPSKAALKRARKKAARQQAGAAAQDAQTASSDHAAAPSSTAAPQEPAVTSCSGAPEADAQRPAADDAVPQAAAAVAPGSPGDEMPSAQQPAAASAASAQRDWWRCPLSGEVMRDPVLCGSEGHSFERKALEQWLEGNPDIHPLSRQPLPQGAASLLPNHALRNMIQQLHLS